MFPVLVGAGLQLGQPGLHKGRLVEQVRFQGQQFLELGQRQLSIDAMGTKGLGMLGLEILDDQLRQVGQIRPGQPLQADCGGVPR